MDFTFSRRGLFRGTVAVGGALAATAVDAGPFAKVRQARPSRLGLRPHDRGRGAGRGASARRRRLRLRHPRRPGERTLGHVQGQGPAVPPGDPRVLGRVHGRWLRPQHRPARGALRRSRARGDQFAHRAWARRSSTRRRSWRSSAMSASGRRPGRSRCTRSTRSSCCKPVCKCVYPVQTVAQIPAAVRQAFVAAQSGEPGPVAVVVPYNLFIEAHDYRCPPPAIPDPPFDDAAFERALPFLSDPKARIGIYAGHRLHGLSG